MYICSENFIIIQYVPKQVPELCIYIVYVCVCVSVYNCMYTPYYTLHYSAAESSSVPRGNTGVIIIAAVVTCIVVGIGILVAVVIVSWRIVQ